MLYIRKFKTILPPSWAKDALKKFTTLKWPRIVVVLVEEQFQDFSMFPYKVITLENGLPMDNNMYRSNHIHLTDQTSAYDIGAENSFLRIYALVKDVITAEFYTQYHSIQISHNKYYLQGIRERSIKL